MGALNGNAALAEGRRPSAVAPSAWPAPVKRVVLSTAVSVVVLAYLAMCAGLAGLASIIIAAAR
jgi:hypothetical protein